MGQVLFTVSVSFEARTPQLGRDEACSSSVRKCFHQLDQRVPLRDDPIILENQCGNWVHNNSLSTNFLDACLYHLYQSGHREFFPAHYEFSNLYLCRKVSYWRSLKKDQFLVTLKFLEVPAEVEHFFEHMLLVLVEADVDSWLLVV